MSGLPRWFTGWWEYIIVAAVLLFGIYAFATLTGFETRLLSRRTSRTAESMYDNYACGRKPGQGDK